MDKAIDEWRTYDKEYLDKIADKWNDMLSGKYNGEEFAKAVRALDTEKSMT